MRILIVEDDVASRFLMSELLAAYGACHVAVDGEEAVEATRKSLDEGQPYDLICLDIMMPRKDGKTALIEIREMESRHGIRPGDGARIIMTTTVSDARTIIESFNEQCEAYLIKPITKEKLMEQIRILGLATS